MPLPDRCSLTYNDHKDSGGFLKKSDIKALNHTIPMAIVAQNIFALVPIAIKSTSANVASIAIIRLAITVTVLSFFSKGFWSGLRQNPKPFLLIGGIFAAHWYTYFSAVKIGSASMGLLGLSSYGLFVNLYALWFLKEKATIFSLMAVLFSIVGVTVLSLDSSFKDVEALFLAVFSGAIYGLLPIVHRKYSHLSTRVRTQFQFLGALIFFLPLIGQASFSYSVSDWKWLIYLSVLGTLIGHGIWVWVTSHSLAVVSSLLYYINIPLVLFWDHRFFGHSLTSKQLLGASIMVGAQLLLPISKILGRVSKGKSFGN